MVAKSISSARGRGRQITEEIQERRDAARIDLEFPVSVVGRQGQFMASNLSSNGLFIRCIDPYGFMLLDSIVGRSRYAAVKNLKMVYNFQRCPIPGTTKTKGGIP